MNNVNQAILEIRQILGERLSTAAAVREYHGKDLTWNPSQLPDAVAFVQSTEEIQAIVKICVRNKAPIIPFGAGTSLEGHLDRKSVV